MSPRPGRISEVIDIDLPQPRDEETRESERYYELVTEVRESLRGHGPDERRGVARPRSLRGGVRMTRRGRRRAAHGSLADDASRPDGSGPLAPAFVRDGLRAPRSGSMATSQGRQLIPPPVVHRRGRSSRSGLTLWPAVVATVTEALGGLLDRHHGRAPRRVPGGPMGDRTRRAHPAGHRSQHRSRSWPPHPSSTTGSGS